jgi:hypothetical protein
MFKTFTVKHKCGHSEKHAFYGKSLRHCTAAARNSMVFNCSECFAKLPMVKEVKKLDIL